MDFPACFTEMEHKFVTRVARGQCAPCHMSRVSSLICLRKFWRDYFLTDPRRLYRLHVVVDLLVMKAVTIHQTSSREFTLRTHAGCTVSTSTCELILSAATVSGQGLPGFK